MGTGTTIYKVLCHATRLTEAAVTRPATAYRGLILSMTGLGILCQLLELDGEWARFSLRNVTEAVLYLHLLACCLYILPKRTARLALAAVYIILYGVAFVDVLCHHSFGSAITPGLLVLVAETDTTESMEFVSHFLTSGHLATPALWVAAYLAAHIIIAHWKVTAARPLPPPHHAITALYALWLAFSAAASAPNIARLVTIPTCKNLTEYQQKLYIPFNPITRLVNSCATLHFISLQTDRCIEVAQVQKAVRCAHDAPVIVLVIGESHSKHHAQIYGYTLPTTPRQAAMERGGRMFRLTDAVTPSNHTDQVFKALFSSKVENEADEWSEYPLLPRVMRTAGYRVTFLSNQFFTDTKMENGTTAFGFNADFFINNPTLSALMFDNRNTDLHPYDGGLLDDYRRLGGSSKREMVIFHLRGQHIEYSQRYPRQFSTFCAEDYDTLRPDLSKEEREQVAHYDNATRYNDAVVDSIRQLFDNQDAVIVYLSDHGEEIYEPGRGLVFRTTQVDTATAKYQYEVPMWIYCTEKYAQKRPQSVRMMVEAVGKRYMTDALPHLIYGLAGIKGSPYKAEYDLLSTRYNQFRQRILRQTADYDRLKTGETSPSLQ